MGMNLHVRGVRDLDGRFAEMMKVKLACDDAEIEYPATVREYFTCPDESEEELRREMEEIDIKAAVSDDSADMQDIRNVDLSKLPKDVKHIRFVVSY